ncbi:glycosyltransferase like 2 family protein [Francisella philomiragia]|uniref:glycosyltransferase family 2 protein n=1 Tax=Francisella philomiragia TaxID=28110 RepID=UPI0005A5797D|nr:glycosyltransferase family 2 protein [Francisella philomiragia]AJI57131.1 glycosyltransferase like 2 family protein [Francisella philomiragia]
MNSISIITVVYNDEANIEATIKNVLSQTIVSDIEFIIIDGGSTDETVNIINKYKQDIDTVISEPDNGIYDAMNKGIKLANNDWICFLNSGDIFYNESVLQNIANKINEQDDVIFGITDMHSINGDFLYTNIPSDNPNMLQTMPFCHQSSLVRREILLKHTFDTFYNIVADYNCFLKIYSEGYKFRFIDMKISCFALGGMSSVKLIATNIEAMYVIFSNSNIANVKKSSFYNSLLSGCINSNGDAKNLLNTMSNFQEEYAKFMQKFALLQNLETKTNELNNHIQEFYTNKIFKIARSILYPINKIKLLLKLKS